MILYLVKAVCCSGLLIGIYFLALEKEKMHRFNRLYLLFSIVFSIIVPLIPLHINTPATPVAAITDWPLVHLDTFAKDKTPATPEANSILPLLPGVLYACITLVMLYRFLHNIYRLLSAAWRNKAVPYQGARLVVCRENIVAHTFLRTIFISEADYADPGARQQMLTHELTHVRQRHSWDILLLELLRATMWFNPFLLLYKKAIQLNHEFLADDAVINAHHDIRTYQHLLLDKISGAGIRTPASSFNYSITKKRITMMTKINNNTRATLKKAALTPFLIGTAFLFCTKVYSQAKPTPRQQKVSTEMIKEQKGKAPELLMAKMSPPAKKSPAVAQLQEWGNASQYGVWLDGKRVSNAILDTYKPSDFALYIVSRLEKNAVNYGKHYYQVDLMTPAYYAKTYPVK